MRTRRILLLIAFIACCNIFASAQIPKLIVWMTDGTKVIYELNKLPNTVFEGDNMFVKTSFVTSTYPASQVGNIPVIVILQTFIEKVSKVKIKVYY